MSHLAASGNVKLQYGSNAMLIFLVLATVDNFAIHFSCTSSVVSLLSCYLVTLYLRPHWQEWGRKNTPTQFKRTKERASLSPGGDLYHDGWSGSQSGNNNTSETYRKIWATGTPCRDNAMDCEIHSLILTGNLSPLAVIFPSLTRGLVCIMSSNCE